jgi:formylglycine-generating enzyme required for sulfatase activity
MSKSSQIGILARNLTLGPCGLLGFIADHRNQGDLQHRFQTLLDTKVLAHRSLLDISDTETLLPLVLARAQLIRCALFLDSNDQTTQQAIKDAMRQVIDQTAVAWSYKPASYLVQPDGYETSFLPFDPCYRKFENLLKDLAQEYRWAHPGLLMVGETLAILFESRREPQLTVHTKILFAAPQRGVLARLTIEQVRGPKGGSGLLIPDPIRCGYLWMEKTFSDGLQNALGVARDYATKKFGSNSIKFDWRWSIDLLSDVKKSKLVSYPIQVKLTGRSGEVAIACGLIAAHPGNPDNRSPGGEWIDPIDPHVGATASFLHPEDPTKEELKWVDSIDDKTLVDRMYSSRLVEIVIAESQPKDSLPTDDRYDFVRASTLSEAYALMTRQHRITRGLNRYFHRISKEHLDKECTPWITPDIQEVVESKERNALVGQRDLRAAAIEPLDEDLKLLFRGKLQEGTDQQRAKLSKETRRKRWIGNRVRIFADSGLGKSMLMLWCEHCTSRPRSAYLPLRLGRTTGADGALDIRWNEGDVLSKLVERSSMTNAFTAYGEENPQANALDIEARKSWLHNMLRKGRVVFLIDALDQIVTDVDGLGSFLGSDLVKRCPVILTGRPESALNRNQAFVDNQWRTLRVMPFDHKRRVRYLGKKLAEKILLDPGEEDQEDEDVNWLSSEEDLRKHQWKDLVEVPLLLNLMKRLATAQEGSDALMSIRSRHDLYALAVKELIQQGWRSAKDNDKALLLDEFKIRDWLERIAWAMVVRHDFSNVFEGDRFAAFRESMDANGSGSHSGSLLNALKQIDLTTDYQVLDRADASGLAFRHRSFLEYFAACHWMAVDSQTDMDSGEISANRRLSENKRKEVLEAIHGLRDVDLQDESILTRQGDWQDTLRFALGHPNPERREELAKQLISHGNPWVVYQALKRDRCELTQGVDNLCRWLVHKYSPPNFGYQDAISETKCDGSDVKQSAITEIEKVHFSVETILDRKFRDPAYLYTLRELVGDRPFYTAYTNDTSLLDRMQRLPSGDGSTWDFSKSFYTIPGGTFKNFGKYHPEFNGDPPEIATFALADFPVTNALFELFCPHHLRTRNNHSDREDDPVVYVSYWMALEFCHWLSEITGERYRLPEDYEWEWATRWQDTCSNTYWWGAEPRTVLCWNRSNGAHRTRSRHEAIATHKRVNFFHPSQVPEQQQSAVGLLDLHGNVWEWQNNFDAGLPIDETKMKFNPLLVGGSWGVYTFRCCSNSRNRRNPDFPLADIGFRVCRIPS